MNVFLIFLQQNYGLLLLPLLPMAVVHVIAFLFRRYFGSMPDRSLTPAQEMTRQAEHVIRLQNEIKRLRTELDVAEARLAGHAVPSKRYFMP